MRGRSTAPPTAYARLVLDVVDRIPRGKVMTYGDVAEMLGRGSPRTVGTVLTNHGREVPWQRVVQASGRPAEPYLQEALALLVAEGCPVRGERVDLAAARWDGRPGPDRARAEASEVRGGLPSREPPSSGAAGG